MLNALRFNLCNYMYEETCLYLSLYIHILKNATVTVQAVISASLTTLSEIKVAQ